MLRSDPSSIQTIGDTNMCKPLGAEFTLQAVMIRAGLAAAPTTYTRTHTKQEATAARKVLVKLIEDKIARERKEELKGTIEETTIYEY